MNQQKVALLFPGQGACYPGVLKQAVRVFPEVAGVMAEVDAVAGTRLSSTVSAAIWRESVTIEDLLARDPGLVQLAIYGTSVAVYRFLESEGLQPDVLMGHSLGEIAALVCGGAFSITEGAQIVCDRTETLRLVADDGYMAALGANRSVAAALTELLGNHDLVVAGENSHAQTVLSGARGKMDRAAEIARVLNLGFFRLNSPCAFHSPLMEPARADFAKRLHRYSARSLRVPVFSPILGRYYQPADSLTDCLAGHLVQAVGFAGGVRSLYDDGVRVVIECGALDALTKLASKSIGMPDLKAIPCLVRDGDDVASFGRASEALRRLGALPCAERHPALTRVAPGAVGPEDEEQFWAECGPSIREVVDRLYTQFRERRAAPAIPAIAGTTPAVTTPAPAGETKPAGVTPSGVGPAPAAAATPPRDTLFRDLASMYAAALEYPEEVFTEQVALEAELGIDSVKQTELLARVAEVYRLPPRPPEFRLADYDTMGRVVDFVHTALSAAAAAPAPACAAPIVEAPARGSAPDTVIGRRDLFGELAAMYAAALEYPVEVFTEQVELEAELGIDSVKQTELLARAADTYGLPPRPPEFKLADYGTMAKVVDFIHQALCAGTAGQLVRV
jgi:malonyl CoA-acyl carrier protein transacylase